MTAHHDFPGPVRSASAAHPLDLTGRPAPLFVLRGAINVFAEETGGRRRFLFQCATGELLFGLPAIGARRVLGLAALGTEVIELDDAGLDAVPAQQRRALLGTWCAHLGAPDTIADSVAALAPLHAAAAQRFDAALAAQGAARAGRITRSWRDGMLRYQQALGALARLVRDGGVPGQPVRPSEASGPSAAPAAPAPAPVPQAGQHGAAFAACHRVAAALGIDLQSPAGLPADAPLDELLAHAGIRSRAVLLRGQWWRADNGPLIGFDQAQQACALLPGRGGYRLVGADGVVQKVDAASAATLGAQALMLYRPLPGGALDAGALLRFGVRGLAPDLGLLLLAGLAASVLALMAPVATGLLVKSVIPRADLGGQWQLVGLLVAAALGAAGFELVKSWLLLRCESRADLALQAALFDRLLRLPVGFFRNYTVGDLANRALGVQEIRNLLSLSALGAMLGALFSLSSLAAMFYYSVPLALAGLGPVALVLALTVWSARSQWRPKAEQSHQRGLVEGLVLQFITGIGKLRAAAAEPRALAAWARIYLSQAGRFATSRRSTQVQELVQACAPPLASLLIFGAMLVLLRRESGVATGDLLAFNAAFGQLLAAVTAMGLALNGAARALSPWRRLKPLLQAVPEDAAGKRQPEALRGAIAFNGVSFRYAPQGKPILQDVSLRVEPGQYVAIVGPSGSGKSTLLRLMMGFEQPQAGTIAFDGQPLDQLDTGALRRRIGVVLQNGRIASGSVFSNIAGSARISHEQAMEAARQVGFADEIAAMPMGLHTVLQDGGGTLSGGQRQRLLLARALARKPAVLLLDEATSALDNRTQAILMDSLARLELTRVVVAHRLSTVMSADLILVVHNGRIVQRGTYRQLLDEDGLFAELAQRQLL
ncbi:NHLP bacteriocin export ABC transporter permease/ATPase subunit [Massilia agilis]|uniref:NHLP bacteriocin export ABC transporter permease/ATPase subunit n=1 Tax=Massilia agilis TaxID=1811226 RepID=A0ABT2DFB3_9BURK|nr:NHLP bacteriocin export ABC transporter permease/ATPase subunit [Massilia agilis]MCS0809106.1 NHLP bacteriocin export ABC transporter permease/ATPase subunit [Massilia agilis]